MKSPADIFTLARRDAANLKKLKDKEGFGETSAAKLFAAIEAKRAIGLDRLIYGLGIRHVGESTAKTLARAYGSFAAFHDAALKIAGGDAAAAEEMDALDDIGTAVIDSVARYFAEEHNRKLVEELAAELTVADAEKPQSRFARRGQDRGVHRLAGAHDARRGEGDGGAAGGEGGGVGVEEDRSGGGRAGGGVEAGGGAEARG